MNDNYTDITIVLDKSNSMHSQTSDTIGGFNRFLDEQRKLPGELKVTLLQFWGQNYSFRNHYGRENSYPNEYAYTAVDIKHVKNLDNNSYVANGNGTALFDALNRAIDDAGQRFRQMPEDKRPGKVLFLVITDGENNCGHITKAMANEKKKHQEQKYGWDFAFIGSTIEESVAENSYGAIAQANSLYAGHGKMDAAFTSFSGKLGNLRGLNKAAMNADEYTAAKCDALSYTDAEKAAVK